MFLAALFDTASRFFALDLSIFTSTLLSLVRSRAEFHLFLCYLLNFSIVSTEITNRMQGIYGYFIF